jgi:hypothetical protein
VAFRSELIGGDQLDARSGDPSCRTRRSVGMGRASEFSGTVWRYAAGTGVNDGLGGSDGRGCAGGDPPVVNPGGTTTPCVSGDTITDCDEHVGSRARPSVTGVAMPVRVIWSVYVAGVGAVALFGGL